MNLQKLFEDIKNKPVFIERHQNYIAALQANRDLLKNHESYLSWSLSDFKRVFTDSESHTCYLKQWKFTVGEVAGLRTNGIVLENFL